MPLRALLSCASLLMLAAAAGAQTAPYPRPDSAPMSSVQVSAPVRPVLLRAEQARQIAGSYEMSNGWTLKVRPGSRYIDAIIDREQPMRLLAVSPDKFVMGDGNVVMEFNRGDAGEDMLMSYVPDPRLADRVTISSTLAQR
ncbi:hypothetical protein [Massilia eurypsychrophila]|nr:hypothetical protein [Massilia eurypsychrophila]